MLENMLNRLAAQKIRGPGGRGLSRLSKAVPRRWTVRMNPLMGMGPNILLAFWALYFRRRSYGTTAVGEPNYTYDHH